MTTQDDGENVSENFLQKNFKEEEAEHSFFLDNGLETTSEQSIDQEASLVFARNLFPQNLEDAASIMKLVAEIESLGDERPASRKARIDLFSLVLARELTRKKLYSDGFFLPAFEENIRFFGYNVSILPVACVVLIRDVNSSCRHEIIERILERALASRDISKEGLSVLKLCVATDRIITLNEEESKEAYDRGWEKHDELLHRWKGKVPSVLAQREHPGIQIFFEKQRKIGSKWPNILYPMKYDSSIYRQADIHCYSTIDSPDWRKREISIRVTDTAIDLFDEVFRSPIIAASCEVFSNPDHPPIKELMKDHFLCKFPYSAVPDFTTVKPQRTRIERYRFPGDKKLNNVAVAVPYKTLIEIARKAESFPAAFCEGIPGPVFIHDISRHLLSIFTTLMQPEYACMHSLEGNPNAPKITIGGNPERVFSVLGMLSLLTIEIGKRVMRQGMDPRLVDSIVEPYVLLGDEGLVEMVRGMIIGGQTADGIGFLTW